jgi:hypothetical protein
MSSDVLKILISSDFTDSQRIKSSFPTYSETWICGFYWISYTCMAAHTHPLTQGCLHVSCRLLTPLPAALPGHPPTRSSACMPGSPAHLHAHLTFLSASRPAWPLWNACRHVLVHALDRRAYVQECIRTRGRSCIRVCCHDPPSWIPLILTLNVTVLDCLTRILFMMGLHYSQIFNARADFNYQLSKHTRTYLSEQPFHSTFIIPCVSQETPPTGLSQAGFSTKLKTALSSSLSRCPLTLDHKSALHTEQRSVFLGSPDPTAFDVQH